MQQMHFTPLRRSYIFFFKSWEHKELFEEEKKVRADFPLVLKGTILYKAC